MEKKKNIFLRGGRERKERREEGEEGRDKREERREEGEEEGRGCFLWKKSMVKWGGTWGNL